MTRKSFITILTLVATLFWSCQKMVEFDTDQVASQLVLNSLPSDGQRLFLNFAYSRFFLTDQPGPAASSPDIKISVNNGSLILVPDSVAGSNYFFPYTPVAGDSLAVTINAEGHLVTASTRIPKPLQISNIRYYQVWDQSMHSVAKAIDSSLNFCIISFDLADPAEEDNYYYVRISERDSGEVYSSRHSRFEKVDTVYPRSMFMCDDPKVVGDDVRLSAPVVELPGGYTPYDCIICSDKAISGTNHRIALYLPILVDTNEAAGFIHQFTLHVESINADRVKYLLGVSSATGLASAFAEPAGVYSNVTVDGEPGLGLFSGISHRSYPIEITPWPYPQNLSKITYGMSPFRAGSDLMYKIYSIKKQYVTRKM